MSNYIQEKEFNQTNAEKLTALNNGEILGVDLATASDITMVKNSLQKCPHCGESYYTENFSTRTCVYYPPIYKDGVNINPDRNIHTTYCTCMNCGKEFSFTR